ncbi:hypothetical protein CJF42_11805 [Pseudoalteromonas sp. NBT06-2]|uniref:hypothetical protein n=1 Tax=Pseudoalteromonas sp. NBT06-2 TaxID=2025950 RepID=UPI000BA73828|nr:hypothetical protein [Pseudoalteromonas sp. NBT06-2]PAJ74166.1 hypothetical protein CJF42_11805 [Pseudoalteromonas sp. NBT06-2]
MTLLKSTLLTAFIFSFMPLAHSSDEVKEQNNKKQVTNISINTCLPQPYCTEKEKYVKKEKNTFIILHINKFIDLLKL